MYFMCVYLPALALIAAASSAYGSACHFSLFIVGPKPDGDGIDPCSVAGAGIASDGIWFCWFCVPYITAPAIPRTPTAMPT